MIDGLAYLAGYAVVAGTASFLEGPVGHRYQAFQLNALIRVGSLLTALVALLAAHGLAIPMTTATLAGLGIGVIAGVGSICYCVAVSDMPVSTVATLSNLYLVVTTLLGIAILGESVTVLKLGGIIAMIAGALLLDAAPARFGVQIGAGGQQRTTVRPLLVMAAYALLVGLSAFLEKPVLRYLDPTEMNAFIATGMTIVAGAALALHGPGLPMHWRTLLPAAVGLMIGLASVLYFLGLRGLPVSVAAALSNASVLITIALSMKFLGQRITRQRGIAIALTILGVTMLATSLV
ncbi:MAG TPA: EamA family transporter [Candidatus Dormibacteraeota bacterium]|nr:EamA family transporter [Candidatus Dormibacteraeota bacterium]